MPRVKSKHEEVLTSVNVREDFFSEFKKRSPRYNVSLKDLTNRAMYLFLEDEDFRKKIYNTFTEYKYVSTPTKGEEKEDTSAI